MNSRRYILSFGSGRGLIEGDGVSAAGDLPPGEPSEMYVYRPTSAGDRLRAHDAGDKLREDRLLGHRALRHVSEPPTKAVLMTHILLTRGDDLGAKALHALLRAYFAYLRHGARDTGDRRRSRFSCLARLRRFHHGTLIPLNIFCKRYSDTATTLAGATALPYKECATLEQCKREIIK